MSTIDLDLGVKDIESAASKLRIQLTSSAKFVAPADDALCSLGTTLHSVWTSEKAEPPPWVLRGESYRFELSINMSEALPSQLDQEIIIQRIVTGLSESKVWQRLCMVPSSIEHTFDELLSEYVVKIFLAADHSDASIPTGYTCWSRSLPQCMQEPSKVSHNTLMFARANLKVSRFHDDLLHMDTSPHDLVERELNAVNEGSSENETDLLESEDYHIMLVKPPYSPTVDLLQADFDAFTDDCNVQEDFRDLPAIYDIVDAALQVCVFGSPIHLAIGAFSVSRHRLVPLTRIAPALWCPDFAKAMMSRSKFIDILSESLAAVARRSTSSRLQSAALRSFNRNGCDYEQDMQGSAVQQQIALRLWTDLQYHVFKRTSTHRSMRFLARRPASSDDVEPPEDLLGLQYEEEDGFLLLHDDCEPSQSIEDQYLFDDMSDLSQASTDTDHPDLFDACQSCSDDHLLDDDDYHTETFEDHPTI